jgi:hypothetical protein
LSPLRLVLATMLNACPARLSTRRTWSRSPTGCQHKLHCLLHVACQELKLRLLGGHLSSTVLQRSLQTSKQGSQGATMLCNAMSHTCMLEACAFDAASAITPHRAQHPRVVPMAGPVPPWTCNDMHASLGCCQLNTTNP